MSVRGMKLLALVLCLNQYVECISSLTTARHAPRIANLFIHQIIKLRFNLG